jgi:SAM-dependent methyltransferase
MSPYAGFATNYDAALGKDSLRQTIFVLTRLIERYGIGFRSAADIGCGTGLFAAHLARLWRIPVFAVDRSLAMLREAFRNGSATHAQMLCQDIRQLRLPRPVDLITANFDTLNHIIAPTELVATFRRVRANLHPGGHFVFDFITDRPLWPVGRIWEHRLPARGCHAVQRILWDPLRRLIFITLIQRWPVRRVSTVERHVERAYPTVDIVRWLREVGFFIRAVLDATTLAQAHRDSSRIVVVARRDSQPLRSDNEHNGGRAQVLASSP